MCGIFGYIGREISPSLLIEGLARLEYRGYDSCGIAGIEKGTLFVKKKAGKIFQLKEEMEGLGERRFCVAILHNRWATHGEPNQINAHPHLDCQRRIAVVHNGIIENYLPLKEEMIRQGHRFLSSTDTEIIAHLIEKFYKHSLEEAIFRAVRKLKGSFALAVISREEPGKLVGVRKASPLIVGKGEEENFLASDIPALLPFTRKVIYLKEEEVAVLRREKAEVFNFEGKSVKSETEEIKMKPEEAEKKGFEHFMLKEIFEQPDTLRKIFSLYYKDSKIVFPDLNLEKGFLKKIKKIYITACGTAYHAGYVNKYFLQKHCPLDVEIDTSSEFRYRRVPLSKNDLLIVISQSGETADTLAAAKEAKKRKVRTLSVCNVLGSSLVKESDGFILTCAGPEMGVASTKAYTAQVLCLYLFSLYLGSLKGTLKEKELSGVLAELEKIPLHQARILEGAGEVERIAKKFSRFGCFLFLGRGINYPLALEGALKLKEISYIPAEGYPAGEMKHGPIALIDEYRAVVCIAPKDNLYNKMISNMQEIKARKGKILGVLNYGDKEACLLSDEAIYVPKSRELSPLLVATALQLFAYFVAKNLGCEIDQPRNLAKSVTVE